MANDITASAVLAQQAIAPLKERFPILGLFSTNFGTEISALGQSANVIVFGNTGAVKKTGKGAEIDYAAEADGNIGTVTVQMGTLIYAAHALSLYDVENLSDQSKAQIIVNNGVSVHRKVDEEIAALALSPSNHVELTCSSAEKFTLKDLQEARGKAAEMNMDMDALVAVLSPKSCNDLLADPEVTKTPTTAAENALVSGKLFEVCGIRICVSSAIPEGYFGYIAEKSSFAIAVRPTTAIGTAWDTVLSVDEGLAMTAKGIDDGVHSRQLYVNEIAFGAVAVKANDNEKRIIALKCAS